MNQRKTLIFLGLFMMVLGCFLFASPETEMKLAPVEDLTSICFSEIQIPLTIPPMELEKTDDKQELKELMRECTEYKELILTLIPEKTSVNYKSHRDAVQQEIKNIDKIYKIYQTQYQKILQQEEKEKKEKKYRLFLEKCEKQYPTATKIWIYLKNLGYNDYVCAGILGNIMAEVGGQTLNLRANIYGENGGYYGICQWSIRYAPGIEGVDLEKQLDYLAKTIKHGFNTYGHLYYSGFNYSSFLSMTNAQSAAAAFCRVYERCGPGSLSQRQRNAAVAYAYFV